jgi:hypothetical protein
MPGMKLYGTDKRELMTVSRVERSGNQLMIKAKVFGTMPLTAVLTPAEVRQGLKLLRLRGILFLLTMPFRRSATADKEKA